MIFQGITILFYLSNKIFAYEDLVEALRVT